MLSAAIYTSLSGKGLQAPSWFPEMKVQTSLPNSPNQQLPPAPRLDIPGPPELPRTPGPHAPAQQTHVHELCCSNRQVRERQSPSLLCINSISLPIALLNTGGAKAVTTLRHSLSLRSPFLKQKSEYHLQKAICRPSHPQSARLGRQRTLAGRGQTQKPAGRDPSKPGSRAEGLLAARCRNIKAGCGGDALAQLRTEKAATFSAYPHQELLFKGGEKRDQSGVPTSRGFSPVRGSCQLTWLIEMGVWTTTPPMISVL